MLRNRWRELLLEDRKPGTHEYIEVRGGFRFGSIYVDLCPGRNARGK